MTTLGERLYDLRMSKKLTIAQVSLRLGLSPNAYSHYEKNRREPNIETLIAMADFYGVTLDYLLCGGYRSYAANEISRVFLTALNKTDVVVDNQLMEEWKKLESDLIRFGQLDLRGYDNLTKEDRAFVEQQFNNLIERLRNK